MSDIDQIIAGGAKTNANFDFNSLINVPARQAAEERYKQEGRDLFKGGIPIVKNPDGTTSVDWAQVSQRLLGHGDVGQAVSTENTDIARQQLKFGQQQSQGIQNFEQGGAPTQQPIVSPPSVNRSASTPVAPPLNRGGVQQPQAGPQQGPGGTSVMQILDAQGIPNDQLGAASASVARQLGVNPTQPIDINDPRVRNVLVPAIQQLKRAGVGNIIPEGQPSPPPQVLAQPGSSVPIQPTPVPTQAITQGRPGPVTNAVTGTTAPAVPSRTDQAIAYYAGIMSNPISPKTNVDLAKTRLESLQKNTEVTPEQKNYIQAVTQGFKGTMADFAAKTEADKTYAGENAKSYIKKYDTIQTAGERARADLPQLDLARRLTEDPNFYSGVGEKYNLLIKRALVALGGDQNTAAPQEAFRKVVSKSILDQIKDMAGTGQIRVAEINIMREAAANPDTTPQANRLLIELASRMQKRSATIADMAQNYNGGRLDSGFDRKVAAYDRVNPMISDKEIADFRKIIGGPKGQAAPGTIQEGATATNKATGQKLLFKGGQWTPISAGPST